MYDRNKAVAYAQKWALARNPAYYNFDALGGDCTSFVSQCLYAGGGIMNTTPDVGWFYKSLNSRSAGWSGVEFLHKFLVNNKGKGPYATVVPLKDVQAGDIIQLSFDGIKFGHSLFVVGIRHFAVPENVFVATHTYDSINRPLSSYMYDSYRVLHINGFRY